MRFDYIDLGFLGYGFLGFSDSNVDSAQKRKEEEDRKKLNQAKAAELAAKPVDLREIFKKGLLDLGYQEDDIAPLLNFETQFEPAKKLLNTLIEAEFQQAEEYLNNTQSEHEKEELLPLLEDVKKSAIGDGGYITKLSANDVKGKPEVFIGAAVGSLRTAQYSRKLVMNENVPLSKKRQLLTLGAVSGAVFGGLVGFAFLGPAGAALGVLIGLAVFLLVADNVYKQIASPEDKLAEKNDKLNNPFQAARRGMLWSKLETPMVVVQPRNEEVEMRRMGTSA